MDLLGTKLFQHKECVVEFKDQRIVVAGASGFIGSHLLEYLCQSGATVLALARNIERMVNVHCQGKLQLVSCDLSDRDLVMPLMREFNPNIVFHLASQPDAEEGFDQANLTLGVNAHCTLNLLEGFAECPGAEVFVYGDSTKVYGGAGAPYSSQTPVIPNSSYAISKAAGWYYCDLFGRLNPFNAISIRPTLVYGPRQAWNLLEYVLESIEKGVSVIELQGGEQTRAPLFVADAVSAYIAAVKRARGVHGQVINVGGAEEMSVTDIARLVVELSGSGISVTESLAARTTEIQRAVADLEEANSQLDWQPVVSLREGIRVLLRERNIDAEQIAKRAVRKRRAIV